MPLIYDRQSARELAVVVIRWERWITAFCRPIRNWFRRKPMKSVYHTLNPHFVVESTVLKEPPSGFPIESILTVGGYVIVPILSGAVFRCAMNILIFSPIIHDATFRATGAIIFDIRCVPMPI